MLLHFKCSIVQVKVSTDWDGPSKDGMVSWIHTFAGKDGSRSGDDPRMKNVDYYGGGARLGNGRFKAIMHQTRDVLKSITSIACTEPMTGWKYSSYIKRHIPINVDDAMLQFRGRGKLNKVHLGMQQFVGWQTFICELVEATGSYRFKLEDIVGGNGEKVRDDVVKQIFKQMKRALPSPKVLAAANAPDATFNNGMGVSKDAHVANSRAHRATLTWEELFQVDKELAM